MTLSIQIDDREHERGKKAQKFYQDMGYNDVEIRELIYGDFIFSDNQINVAFEYKTIEDFINSIQDNRVFNQALNQANTFHYHFVIVVGTDKEKQKIIREKQRYTGTYMNDKQFWGAVGSIVNISSFIQAPSQRSAFICMERLAVHCCSLKPVVKRFPKSRGTPAFRLLNNNVGGVGYIMAQRICDELGLEVVEDVFGLTVADLTCVDGVGFKTAEKILSQLKREFN